MADSAASGVAVAPAPDARAGLPMLAPHLAAELAARPGAVGRIATTIEAGLQARLEALVARWWEEAEKYQVVPIDER